MPTTGAHVPPVLADLAGCTPAPFGWRALALLLDTFLVGFLATIILTRIVLPIEMPDAEDVFDRQVQVALDYYNQIKVGQHPPQPALDPDYLDLLAVTNQTFFLVFLVYFVGSELGMRGATLGKRVFVLRAAQWGSAEPPRVMETLVRCIIKTISLVGWQAVSLIGWPILLLNLAPIAFHRSRRAGHDLLARTIVTGDPLPPTVEEPPLPDED
jgi:uncharacterized RDD family membrane protein YckC